LYGEHPYAHPSSGTIDTVEKLTRDDLIRFHKQYYVASNAIIVLIGDISLRRARIITNQVLSGMAAGEKPSEQVKVMAQVKGDTIRTLFPSEQTHIYSGVAVIPRGDPDHVPLYVGNHILGGSGLVSKISDEVREKRGLAYSASSHFSPMKQLGPFTMGLQTRNDQADEALAVLQQTLADFINNGPSEAELESARKNITGGFVLRYDSNQKLAEYIAMIAFYDLPLDYLDTFTGTIDKISLDTVKDAYKRRLHPDKFLTVIVGKKVEQVATKENKKEVTK
jgi:zinc protease